MNCLLPALLLVAPAGPVEPGPDAQVPAPPQNVDVAPLPVRAVRAFEFLTFDRPVLLTHAGDGSGRVFVVAQKGKIFQFPNDPEVEEATLFADLSDRVAYKDNENEEGLLGLAFHPDYASNGRVFVYYTTSKDPHTSIVSEFGVTGEGLGQRLDAGSERELYRLEQPFWNHNAGTIAFGPDGMFYVAFGDGGAADDPLDNGQNTGTPFGAMLRLDLDADPDPGKAYAVPADNPHFGEPGFLPEIYAHGFRNPWRFSFDAGTSENPGTGELWLADVGQNLWEEIDVIEPGANYGWSAWEGFHPFPPDRRIAYDDGAGMTFPVWEYPHDVGKSITGGHVYRGSEVPELVGKYLYADYVTGLIWALERGEDGRAISNREISGYKHPVMSFGEGPDGEVYFTTTFGQIWTFAAE